MNTQTSNSMRHALFSCISFFLFLNIAQAQEPTIATCQGDQYYCIDDSDFELCVEITLNPDFMAPIDHFEIDWGDGSNIASIPNSPNPIAPPHTYDLSGFYGSCTYQTQYFVTLTTFIVGDDPVVNIIPVYFRNPPQAIFSINPPVVCVGQQVCFNETACPATGFNIVSWNYGDGSSGLDPCHTYAQAGSYNITLTVENFCGTATTTHSLEVIEEAQAIAIPEPGYVDATTQPIIVCLEAGVSEITIPLNGDSLSTNETFYQWGNLNQYPCASWEPGPNGNNDPTPNIPDPEITFCDEGVYYVILQVDNACNIPSFDTLVFQVVSGEALGQLNQPDACLSLDYQPTPYNPNASYTINGVLQNTFPVTLGIGDYTVEGTLLNECGDQIVIDQFSVTAQPVVSIVPLSNDILCPGTAPVYLDASPNGGVWSGSANLIVINDSTFFNPNSGGEIANLTYTAGPPGCQDSESITITVEDGGFTANDVLICSWADDFQLIASPTPDNWFSVDCPS